MMSQITKDIRNLLWLIWKASRVSHHLTFWSSKLTSGWHSWLFGSKNWLCVLLVKSPTLISASLPILDFLHFGITKSWLIMNWPSDEPADFSSFYRKLSKNSQITSFCSKLLAFTYLAFKTHKYGLVTPFIPNISLIQVIKSILCT